VPPMSRPADSQRLTTQLSARILSPGGRSLAARIDLSYDSRDPYAVVMAIRVPGDDEVLWMFGRDLLADGTRRPSGMGDVTVAPCPEAPADLLHITLHNDVRTAHIEMEFAPINEFLRSTYESVPAGWEGMFLRIDDDVRALGI
jgi:hypothetical protein